MKKLTILADWEHDSLRRNLVQTAITSYLQNSSDIEIRFVAAGTESLQAAYILAQLAESAARYDDPAGSLILVDVLSEKLERDQVKNAELLNPLIIKLKNGLYIVGPNRENVFALIKPYIEAAFSYPGFKLERAFPARDSYSRIVAHLMQSLEDELELDQVHLDTIAETREEFVGYVDTMGNVYTTLTVEDMKGKVEPTMVANLLIGETVIQATYVEYQYQAEHGKSVIYHSFMGTKSNPYLAIRSNPALHHIKPGTRVILQG